MVDGLEAESEEIEDDLIGDAVNNDEHENEMIEVDLVSVVNNNDEHDVISKVMQYTDVYKYLGIYLDKFLDFRKNEERLSKAGSRVLGSCSKLKHNECMGYKTYKCFKICVSAILEYS